MHTSPVTVTEVQKRMLFARWIQLRSSFHDQNTTTGKIQCFCWVTPQSLLRASAAAAVFESCEQPCQKGGSQQSQRHKYINSAVVKSFSTLHETPINTCRQSSMGPYEEILQAAAGLQFQPPPADNTQHGDGLSQAQQIARQASRLHDLELHLSAVLAAVACRTVTDQKQLATRAASLQRISSTLQLITASKDSIADHLRSASVRPSVPVAPEFQPDFANMLRCAASNAAVLQEGLQVLQWAASLTDKPSCWEDNLHVIRVAAQGLKENVVAMKEFDQHLSTSTATPAVGQQQK